VLTSAQVRLINDVFEANGLQPVSLGMKGWEQLLVENIQALADKLRLK
jgi:hypothetical protein